VDAQPRLTLLQYESPVMPLAIGICARAAGSAAAASAARAASGEERRMVGRVRMVVVV